MTCSEDINGAQCQGPTSPCTALRNCFLDNGWALVTRVKGNDVPTNNDDVISCRLAANESVPDIPHGVLVLCRDVCPPIKSSTKHRSFCQTNCKQYTECIVLRIIDVCSQHDTVPITDNRTCSVICIDNPTNQLCNDRSSCSAISECYRETCRTLAVDPTRGVNGGVCSGVMSSPPTEIEIQRPTTHISRDETVTMITSLQGDQTNVETSTIVLIVLAVAIIVFIAIIVIVIAVCAKRKAAVGNRKKTATRSDVKIEGRNDAPVTDEEKASLQDDNRTAAADNKNSSTVAAEQPLLPSSTLSNSLSDDASSNLQYKKPEQCRQDIDDLNKPSNSTEQREMVAVQPSDETSLKIRLSSP